MEVTYVSSLMLLNFISSIILVSEWLPSDRMPKDMREKAERRPNMKLGKFGAYKCPHCPDSQIFNTQEAYTQHQERHIEFVKSGAGSYGDYHLSGQVEYIEPRPDKRAGREMAKVHGKNPNLVPMGQRHRLEEMQERALQVQGESLLNPDYLQVNARL